MVRSETAAAVSWRDELVRARTRREHGSEAFLTTIAQIAREIPQTEIASQLGASQAQVSRWASKGRSLIEIAAGGHGWSPFDVAQRYSRGEITRDQVIEALTTWPYAHRDLSPEEPRSIHAGSIDDVHAAALDGLIDEEVYRLALEAFTAELGSDR
jgi:hypothetical protein